MRGSIAVALVLALLLSAEHSARAESPPTEPSKPALAPAPTEHRVDFRADRVELEFDPRVLGLSGNVVVRAHRFRLTSERMTLTRSSRGVHVEGSGRLALCPCPGAPVTFGFSQADLAPPSDVLLYSATLRVGGIPIFWSPYLWLRSRDRAGMLPPTIQYRGEEGVLLGTGVHLPLGKQQTPPRTLDVTVGGYLRGGVHGAARLGGAEGRVAMDFDYFRGSSLDLVSTYAHAAEHRAVFAERLDLLRGSRATIAPAALERLTLPSDRLRIGVGRAESSVVGFLLAADSPRAGSLDELGWFGPGLFFGTGGAIGPRANYAIAMSSRSANNAGTAAVWAGWDSALSASVPLGVLLYQTRARQRADLVSLPDRAESALSSEWRSTLGAPLLRRYPGFVHGIQPFAELLAFGTVRDARETGSRLPDLAPLPRSGALLAGLENAIGFSQQRATVALKFVSGLAGRPAEPRGVVAGRVELDTTHLRASSEVRSVPSAQAIELSARAVAGKVDGIRLGLRLDGQQASARETRLLFDDDFAVPYGAPLARPGWSAGARLSVPWASVILTEIGSDVDISEERWLASSAALGYRHPCQCLALKLAGSRRIGRGGADLGLELSLSPR